MKKIVYPDARRSEDVVDDYHGTKIADPYRWLENPDSEETKSFVAAQNALTNSYLEQYPDREKLRNRVKDMYDFSRYNCPAKYGDNYYYLYNSGLQNQSVMYAQDSLDGISSVFFDPNTLSEDGTIAMLDHVFSPDGEYMAYTLSEGGSDWVTINFKKSPSGDELPDAIKRVKYSTIGWAHDNSGIFYSYYPKQEGGSTGTDPALDLNHQVYYHRLWTPQREDVLVFELPDNPTWIILASVSDCGHYLLLKPQAGAMGNGPFYYADLRRLTAGIKGALPHVKLIDNFDAEYQYVTNEGRIFTFRTNLNASNYKLINIDLDHPEMEHWVTLVGEQSGSALEWAARAGNDTLVLCYLRDVKHELYVRKLSSGQGLTKLPLDVGSIMEYTANKSNNEVFYNFSSFLTPSIIYRYDVTQPDQAPQIFQETKLKGFDFSQYETKQIFYKSNDGTKVPMFIFHRKGILLDGNHPALMHGYGGFGASITPSFSASHISFVSNLDGVVASPNIRGGGEYGETWHQAGAKGNKQNTFDDFQAAAEYLITEGYTSSSKLTIFGGSNGGLLMGACINQRPDLFGCVLALVPIMDMLRFMKRGSPVNSEYGCSDEPDEFAYLVKYSPLHNVALAINGRQYPAILVMTGDHDDRALPLHSYKFIAQLQHVIGKHPNQSNPLLLRVDTDTGHLAGTSMAKAMDGAADSICFVMRALNLQWHDETSEEERQ